MTDELFNEAWGVMFDSPQNARDLMKTRFDDGDPVATYFYFTTYLMERSDPRQPRVRVRFI